MASTAGEEPLAVLEDLYHHLEPLEDFLAVKICLLLLEARAAKERRSGLRRNQPFCARSVVTVFFSISCLQEQQIPQNAFTNTVNIVSTPATQTRSLRRLPGRRSCPRLRGKAGADIGTACLA